MDGWHRMIARHDRLLVVGVVYAGLICGCIVVGVTVGLIFMAWAPSS